MQPVKIYLSSHTKNDTWEGVTIGPVLFNGIQPSTTLSSCRWYFRRVGSATVQKLTSADSTITIDDAATWEITVNPIVLSLDVGSWDWDFETIDSAGVVRTLYAGILDVTKEQTYE